jgi:hypothetical protein
MIRRPRALWILLGIRVFQGISATPCGFLLALDPTGRLMHMPQEMLRGSIFHDFRIPGLILCVVLGLGAFFVAAGVFFLPAWAWTARLNPFKRQHWAWLGSVLFGLALMTWITVQAMMIGLGSWLQPVYFGVGLAISLLSLVPSVRGHLRARPSRQDALYEDGSPA